MKIDAHHHLWQYNENQYGWIPDEMSVLKRDYLPPELKKALDKAGVDGTVVVQARQIAEETSWLLEQADAYPFIRGVVGWVDLQSEKVDDQLDYFSRDPRLVGVRHVLHDEADDEFMMRPAFMRGIGKLQDYNLTYDLLLFPRHLSIAERLVRRFPDQRFVLDHIGKPNIKDRELEPWLSGLARLASHPNVWCKISGMVTEADWKNWKRDDFRIYLDRVVELFGTGRIMTGSDWPVCCVAGEYEEVMTVVEDYFRGFSESEKAHIFGRNCMDFYGIPLREKE